MELLLQEFYRRVLHRPWHCKHVSPGPFDNTNLNSDERLIHFADLIECLLQNFCCGDPSCIARYSSPRRTIEFFAELAPFLHNFTHYFLDLRVCMRDCSRMEHRGVLITEAAVCHRRYCSTLLPRQSEHLLQPFLRNCDSSTTHSLHALRCCYKA